MGFTVIIPARLHSQRLPGKVLLDLAGKPVLQHVWERARQSNAERVIIALDDEKVADSVRSFGADFCVTSTHHPSGTDRLQEVCQVMSLGQDEVIVNVQGDEPLMPPAVINQVAHALNDPAIHMATLYEPIETLADALDPNIVKVVTDAQDRAIYFSRAPVPWARDSLPDNLPDRVLMKRHLGIYAYRVSLLDRFVSWGASSLEETEKLEQLRVLYHGVDIQLACACESIPPGIDTLADLERTRRFLMTGG